MLDVYPALVKALEHDAANKNNTEAKRLFKRIKSVSFLLTSAFLRDVLAVVTKLSKVFQRDTIDVSVVNAMVTSTIEKLNQLKCKNGIELESTYNLISASGTFRQVKLIDMQTLRMLFQNNAVEYLEKLVDNLNSRFEDTSAYQQNLES